MIKLHLGCGKRNFGSDWIHIDGDDHDHIQYKDIVNLEFEDGTVDLIYGSHVFEYFDRESGLKVLKKWRQKLKTGGVLRLAVPDFRELCKIYMLNAPLEKIIGPLYGKWSMNGDIIYHKTTYDFESLEKMLKTAGFKTVRRYDWRETEHAQFDDHSQAYYPHMDKEDGTLVSLNVEATK